MRNELSVIVDDVFFGERTCLQARVTLLSDQ